LIAPSARNRLHSAREGRLRGSRRSVDWGRLLSFRQKTSCKGPLTLACTLRRRKIVQTAVWSAAWRLQQLGGHD
jgi:hypothetical protein